MPDLRAGDEEDDLLASVLVADVKVADAAEVADGDLAVAVELVAADPVLN